MRAERSYREVLRTTPAGGLPDGPLPAWARAADWVMAALICSGAVIAVSGGFRASVGAWRFNVTSPFRLVAWAVAVAVVRSAVARRPTIADHLQQRASLWARAASVRAATLVVVATRPTMCLVGYLALALFGYAANARPFHEFESELLNLPLRWDAGWYLQLAANGYEFLRGAEPSLQQNVVFFPGYPVTVRAVALLFGNTMPAYVVAAQIASMVAFWIALIYVHELASIDLDSDQAAAALWLVAAYPFAIFFGAIYSESLYLAAAAGAFAHVRRGEPVRSAAWSLVAGVTRPNGFLLSVPLAILACTPSAAPWPVVKLRPMNRRTMLCVLAPLVGAALYSVFVWQLTGSPFTWITGHTAWDRHYQGLDALVVDRYRFITHNGVLGYASKRPYDLLNAIAAAFALISVWPVARRFGLAYAAFIIVQIVPPLAVGGMMSAGRLTSVLFPSFLWLAAAVPVRHRPGWIAAFAALQALCAALFYTWRPLY